MNVESLILIVFIIGVAIAGSKLGFGKFKPFQWLSNLFQTGLIFILMGFLLGPHALNLLTPNINSQLDPLVIVVLSWIGFLYGAHLEWKRLKRFPLPLFTFTLWESFITIVFVLIVFIWGFSERFGTGYLNVIFPSVFLAITAGGTAPAAIFSMQGNKSARGITYNTLQFVSSLDDIPGLILLGVASAFSLGGIGETLSLSILLIILISVTGILFGLMLRWALPISPDGRVDFLLILALVSVSGGVAAYIGMPPLIIGLIVGITFANFSPQKEKVYGALAEREHSFYVFFLILAGSMWNFDLKNLLLLLPLYIISRIIGKLIGTYSGQKIFMRDPRIKPSFGLGLFSQGGIAVAMIVSLTEYRDTIMTIVIIAVFINEILAPVALRRALKQTG